MTIIIGLLLVLAHRLGREAEAVNIQELIDELERIKVREGNLPVYRECFDWELAYGWQEPIEPTIEFMRFEDEPHDVCGAVMKRGLVL